MTEYTQEKVNELLYNAWAAYRRFIRYDEYASDETENNLMYGIYNDLAFESVKEARIWLRAWSVMTGIEMNMAELSKFKESDFAGMIEECESEMDAEESSEETPYKPTPLWEPQFNPKQRMNY